MASRVKGITIQINGDTTGLDKALKSVNSTIIKTQSDLKDVNRLLKLDPGNTELLAQKQRLLGQAIENTKDKLKTLQTAQQQATKQLAEGKIGQEQFDALQREIAETEQKLNKFQGEADQTEKELKEMGDAAEDASKDTGKLDVSLKSMIQNAAVGLAVDGLKALASHAKEAAKYVIDVGSSFEAGMDKVQAVSGASAADMEKLSAKAKEMGATTKFSASEAADALNYMAMAGWKTNDMLQGIEGVMNLAAASGEDLATTSDIVTDALTAFGKSAEESGRLADIMAAASSNANTNVSMMGETFKYAAPVAGALGASMEDTAIAVGLMANSGIKASQAGTALRTGLSNLAKPTKQMKEWMDKYNISLVENEDGSVNLRETMIQLREKMGQLSETEQAAAASAIFGKNAMSGWMAIINGSDADFDKLTQAIDNSEGAAQKMAETMGDNLQGKITIFQSALEGLGITLYEKVSGPLTKAVEVATGVLSGLTEALADHRTENELVIDQIKEANDAVTASMNNAGKIQADAAAKAGQINVLAEALVNLNKKESLDEAQKKRLKEIYDDLVELVPDMAGYYNEETGKIDLTTEAVKNLTKARREEIIEQGRLAALQEIYEELGRAQGELQQAMADLTAMQKQKKMWEDLRDRIGEAQGAYANLARDSQGNIIDTTGIEGLRDELLNMAQAALNSGAITKKTYDQIAEMFNDDSWSQSELDAAYQMLQSRVEETDIDIKNASDGIDELQDTYDEAALSVKNLEESMDSSNKATREEIGVVDDSANSISAMTDEKIALREATEDSTDSTEESTDAIDEETKSLDENKQASENMRKESMERSKAESDARKEAHLTKEEIEAQAEAVHKAAEAQKKMREAATKARDDMRKAFEDIKKSAEDAFKINPFDQWQQDTEKGMLAFEEAMKSQRDGLLRYKDNLTTVKENLGQVAPEFVQYLEDMGQSGSQFVAEIADAFRTGNADTVYRLMDEYKQAMDIQDDVATILEQDKLALILGLDALSPEAIKAWEDLGYAFDEGVNVIRVKGGEMTQATSDAFWQAVEVAKQTGMEVPAGLAESIRNSEDPEQAVIEATATLNESIRGRGEEMLAAAKELGINVPTGIAEIIRDPAASQEQVQSAVMTLRDSIVAKNPDFETAGNEAGGAMGEGTATGITEKDKDVSGAAEGVVNSAKETAKTSSDMFRLIGRSGMEMFKSGIADKQEEVKTKVESVVKDAISAGATAGSTLSRMSGRSAMEAYRAGVADKEEDLASGIQHSVSNALSSAAVMSAGLCRMAGGSSMMAYAAGMAERTDEVAQAAVAVVSRASEVAKFYADRVFNSAGTSAAEQMAAGMRNAIQSMDQAMDSFIWNVSNRYAPDFIGGIGRMRDATNFWWNLPHLQMPHPWVYGRFSVDPPEVPVFGIDWYAKAMDKGMILNKPTIFGMQGNRFLAGGEAGSETVVGTNSLMQMIKDAVGQGGTSFGDINIAVTSPVTDARTLAKELEVEISKNIIRRSGRF